MANQEIKSEVVTILDIGEIASGKGISILSEVGDRYSFFKEWEGQPTDQMNQFKELNLDNHSIVKIRYIEKPNERKPSNPFRNVRSFQEANKVETSKAEPIATTEKIDNKNAQIVRSAISKAMIKSGHAPSSHNSRLEASEWENWVITGIWAVASGKPLKSDPDALDGEVNRVNNELNS